MVPRFLEGPVGCAGKVRNGTSFKITTGGGGEEVLRFDRRGTSRWFFLRRGGAGVGFGNEDSFLHPTSGGEKARTEAGPTSPAR